MTSDDHMVTPQDGRSQMRSSVLLPFMQDAAREAGRCILAADRTSLGVMRKTSDRDLVTNIDMAVQEYLTQTLHERFPSASFLVEEDAGEVEDAGEAAGAAESGCASSANGCFIIDPIDGTTNFIRGFRHSAVSIGYAEGGRMLAGVVYAPYDDELFSAARGEGATLGDEPIHASLRPLSQGLVLVGTSPYDDSNNDRTFQIMRMAYEHALDIRRSGSAALDLCYVACGRCDLYFEMKLSPWDFAAGSLIVSEAGGIVTDFRRGELQPWVQRPCGVIAGGEAAWWDFVSLIG